MTGELTRGTGLGEGKRVRKCVPMVQLTGSGVEYGPVRAKFSQRYQTMTDSLHQISEHIFK